MTETNKRSRFLVTIIMIIILLLINISLIPYFSASSQVSQMNHLKLSNQKSYDAPNINEFEQCVCDQNNSKKIILLGLPKAGTNTFHSLFQNIGCNSVHWGVRNIKPIWYLDETETNNTNTNKSINLTRTTLLYMAGVLIKKAFENNRPLLYYFNDEYNAFTQMDICMRQSRCIWPQISWYKLFYQQYNDSYFILNYRNFSNHMRSFNHWPPWLARNSSSNYRWRLNHFDIPNLPKGHGADDSEFKLWISNHYNNVSSYFEKQSQAKFIQFDIENGDLDKVSHFLHCDITEWPHKNPNKWLKRQDKKKRNKTEIKLQK